MSDNENMNVDNNNDDINNTTENTASEPRPVISLKLDNYPTSVPRSEVMSALGGIEEYSEEANKLAYAYNAPETVQELILEIAKKYTDEKTALEWFDKIDDMIENKKPSKNHIAEYALMPPFSDMYHRIEKDWLSKNNTSINDKLEILKNQFKSSSYENDAMKNASDDDWNDALILNLNSRLMLGTRWEAGRDKEVEESWHDLIDDLMLLYAAMPIYISLRAYGTAVAYYF